MATDIGPMVATACFRAISSPLGRSTNPAMKKEDVGYTLGQEGVLPYVGQIGMGMIFEGLYP